MSPVGSNHTYKDTKVVEQGMKKDIKWMNATNLTAEGAPGTSLLYLEGVREGCEVELRQL